MLLENTELINSKEDRGTYINGFIIERSAKLTDLLSVASITPSDGLLVSRTFKDLLEKYFLGENMFIPASIIKRGSLEKLVEYYLFVPEKRGYQYLNFDEYEFYYSHQKDRKFKIVNYIEYEYLYSKQKVNEILKCSQFRSKEAVFVNNSFPLDIGVIYWGDSFDLNTVYVSEELKVSIIQHNLSGIEFGDSIVVKST